MKWTLVCLFACMFSLSACFVSAPSSVAKKTASNTLSVSIDRASSQSVSTNTTPIYFDISLDEIPEEDIPKSAVDFSGPSVQDFNISKVSDKLYRLSINTISGTGRLDVTLKLSFNKGIYFEPKQIANATYVDILASASGITALKNIKMVDGNFDNTCYLAGTQIYCAGINGVPTHFYNTNSFYPKKVPEWNDVKRFCSGEYSTCVLKNDGTVNCGGDDSTVYGAAAADDDDPAATALSNVISYDCGQAHSCGIVSDGVGDEGELFCWGGNDAGQVGQGTSGGNFATATQVAGMKDLKKIRAGHGHNCVIKSDDTLSCWGYNNHGQVGVSPAGNVTTPQDVAAVSNVRDVELGRYNTCYINSSDQLYCFGQNNHGQLGDGTTTSNHLPQLFLSNVKKVSVGYELICALTNSDEVYCAGQNSFNRLPITGASVGQDFTTPTKLDISVTPKDIFASRESFCVTYGVDEQALCFGESRFGQFGNEFGTVEKTPVAVASLTGVTDLSAGYDYGCSLKDNKVSCYGAPYFYRTGNNVFVSFDYEFHTPSEITSAVTNPVDVEVGRYHSCAINNTGEVYCWGYRPILGEGGAGGSLNTPARVTGLTGISQVSLSALSSCAIDATGSVSCWGLGALGQLGQGATDETNQGTPVSVTLPSAASKLSSKHNNHCALVSGSVYCWGANHYNQLGDSGDITADFYGLPNVVPLVSPATDIAVGYTHSCALVSGEVYCWGNADFGQLGTAQTTGNHDAVKVAGLSGISKIWAGYRHNCALNSSNELYCWGSNLLGQVGNNEMDTLVSTPVKVSLPAGAVNHVSLGKSQSCAIVGTDQVCWGDHSNGQLGIGDKQWYTPATGASVMYNADFDQFPR